MDLLNGNLIIIIGGDGKFIGIGFISMTVGTIISDRDIWVKG
jgi:hypothetical protein